MRIQLFILSLFISLNILGQSSYSGFIDKYPITFVTDIYTDGVARATYAYNNFDNPIAVTGKLSKGLLVLYEKDAQQKNTAVLKFDHFNAKNKTIEGTWTNLSTKKELKITLTKDFDIESNEDGDWNEREIIQEASLQNHYFKLLLSKSGGTARVTGIKLLEKKTDKLLQQIELDCQLMGINSVSTGDFNFDGIPDFSVFESSYAGPNTSSLYFLYDPETKKYFDSGFTGTSLEFDSKAKKITENNQCCAGSKVTKTIYKIVKNKMVKVEEHCYTWSEKQQKLIEGKLKDCQ